MAGSDTLLEVRRDRGTIAGWLARRVRSRGGWRVARPNGRLARAIGRKSTPPLCGCQERALRGLALPTAPRDRYFPRLAGEPRRPAEGGPLWRVRKGIRTSRPASRVTRCSVREGCKDNSEATSRITSRIMVEESER